MKQKCQSLCEELERLRQTNRMTRQGYTESTVVEPSNAAIPYVDISFKFALKNKRIYYCFYQTPHRCCTLFLWYGNNTQQGQASRIWINVRLIICLIMASPWSDAELQQQRAVLRCVRRRRVS